MRYEKRAVYYEKQGRLAESILNYRLALKLEPDDHATLEHVQELARTLSASKRDAKSALRENLDAGRLADARAEPAGAAHPRPLRLGARERVAAGRRRARTGRSSELPRARAPGLHLGRTTRSARSAFEAVLALDDQNESARGYLAYIDAIRAEESRRGREGTRRSRRAWCAPRTTRSAAKGYHQNALAADRSGDPYAAIRDDLRALELAPEHGEARQHLAELRRRLSPDVARLIETGQGHYQQEELHSALDAWRRALLIDPTNEEARAYVARAELLLQNLERLRAEPGSAVGAQ